MWAIASFPSTISPALRLRMIHKILPRASGWVLILLCQVGLASSLNSCGASEISLNLFELEINDLFVTGLKGLTRGSKHT